MTKLQKFTIWQTTSAIFSLILSKKHTMEENDGERNRPSRMSDAEIITIMMMFLSSGQCTQLNPQRHRRHSCILFLP